MENRDINKPGRGGWRGGGRPKGSKTKKLVELAAIQEEGETPLDFLTRVYRDAENKFDINLRVEAARNACPYIHRKQPIAVEQTSKGDINENIRVVGLSGG